MLPGREKRPTSSPTKRKEANITRNCTLHCVASVKLREIYFDSSVPIFFPNLAKKDSQKRNKQLPKDKKYVRIQTERQSGDVNFPR